MASTNNKIIEVSPQNWLLFEDIPKKSSTARLKITNVLGSYVLFKVKTTAPDAYKIKPSQTLLHPEESKDVYITMKETESYPSLQNQKHKFLIQAAVVGSTPLESDECQSFWKSPDVSITSIYLLSNFKKDFVEDAPINKSHVNEKNIQERLANQQDKAQQNSQGSGAMSRRDSQLSNSHTNNNVTSQTDLAKSIISNSEMDEKDFDYKKHFEKLVRKVEEQEKQMHKVSEERDLVYKELTGLKGSIEQRKAPLNCNNADNQNGFQFLHVFIVALVSLLVGIFFSV